MVRYIDIARFTGISTLTPDSMIVDGSLDAKTAASANRSLYLTDLDMRNTAIGKRFQVISKCFTHQEVCRNHSGAGWYLRG